MAKTKQKMHAYYFQNIWFSISVQVIHRLRGILKLTGQIQWCVDYNIIVKLGQEWLEYNCILHDPQKVPLKCTASNIKIKLGVPRFQGKSNTLLYSAHTFCFFTVWLLEKGMFFFHVYWHTTMHIRLSAFGNQTHTNQIVY